MRNLSRSIRSTLAALLAAGLTSVGAVTLAPAVAHAQITPPWETGGSGGGPVDTNEVGSLIFYNASGNPITSGSVTGTTAFGTYVQGTTILNAVDSKATLFAFTPVNGSPPGSWNNDQLSTSTVYPVSSPAGLASSQLPVVTNSTANLAFTDYVGEFPNADTSNTDGYGNVYQLRLYSTSPTQTSTYDSADILISGSGNSATWSVLYPGSAPTATTTTLTASPVGTAPHGTSVTLTATVSSATAGESVQFQYVTGTNTAHTLGSATTDGTGKAVLTTSALPVGTEKIIATFAGNATFSGSTGTIASYQVTGALTTTVLTASPVSPTTFGTSVTLTATVTSGGNPLNDGSVQFFNGSTALAAAVVPGANGVATLTTNALPSGTLSLSATFTDTNDTNYQPSTGTLSYTVNGISTTTTVAALPASPQNYGTSVTFTATVSTGVAGTVQFQVNSANVGSAVTVSNNQATFTTTTLPVGSDTVGAVFTPTSGNYSSSSGSTSFTVNAAPTTTVISVTPASPQLVGVSETLKATITPSTVAGTVQFQANATNIGSPVTVANGIATFTTSSLPAGSDTLSVTFTPTSSNYATSTDSTSFLVVTPTTTSVAAQPTSPQQYGTSVTFTATVTTGVAGSVQFQVNFTNVGSPVTVSNGQATYSTTSLPVGSNTVNAVFLPTSSSYASSSGSTTFQVNAVPTSTALTASPVSPTTYGTSVTLTATVSSGGSPLNDGTVQFFNGSTSLGAPVAPGVNGVATLTTSLLPSGTLSLSATFTDTHDSNYQSSTGNLSYTVNGIATTTAVSASPASPQTYGTPVTFTATVSTGVAGTVQFQVNSANVGSPVTVSANKATYTSSTLPAGSDTVTAIFTPTSGNYSGSNGSTSFTVNAASTTTGLTITPASPQLAGIAETLTATVSPSTVAGTVQFQVNSTDIGSPVAVSGGVATFHTSSLPAGSDQISAVFTPTSANYTGSNQTKSFVVLTPTATSLSALPASPQPFDTSVTFTATVTTGVAGTVQFQIDGQNAGSPVTVSSNRAQYSTSSLAVGAHTVKAVFTPTSNLDAASSATTSYTVTALPTTTALSASPASPQNYGTPVTLTATVSPSSVPGSVQFSLGTQSLGAAVTVHNGVATLVTSSLPGGADTIKATFTPSAGSGYAASSGTVSYTVVYNGPSGKGYWLVASDGGVFNYGNAGYFGSAGKLQLTAPVVGMAGTPDAQGYWLVASDGGVFNYGDAVLYGSAGKLKLTAPVVGITSTPDGKGYWLVAADGGVFNYGDAVLYGSAAKLKLAAPIVGITATPDGKGYWLYAADGGVFNYGDAVLYGSAGSLKLKAPVVGAAES